MEDNEKKENVENKEDLDKEKTPLEKILFWLKVNALLLAGLIVSFWIFVCLL